MSTLSPDSVRYRSDDESESGHASPAEVNDYAANESDKEDLTSEANLVEDSTVHFETEDGTEQEAMSPLATSLDNDKKNDLFSKAILGSPSPSRPSAAQQQDQQPPLMSNSAAPVTAANIPRTVPPSPPPPPAATVTATRSEKRDASPPMPPSSRPVNFQRANALSAVSVSPPPKSNPTITTAALPIESKAPGTAVENKITSAAPLPSIFEFPNPLARSSPLVPPSSSMNFVEETESATYIPPSDDHAAPTSSVNWKSVRSAADSDGFHTCVEPNSAVESPRTPRKNSNTTIPPGGGKSSKPAEHKEDWNAAITTKSPHHAQYQPSRSRERAEEAFAKLYPSWTKPKGVSAVKRSPSHDSLNPDHEDKGSECGGQGQITSLSAVDGVTPMLQDMKAKAKEFSDKLRREHRDLLILNSPTRVPVAHDDVNAAVGNDVTFNDSLVFEEVVEPAVPPVKRPTSSPRHEGLPQTKTEATTPGAPVYGVSAAAGGPSNGLGQSIQNSMSPNRSEATRSAADGHLLIHQWLHHQQQRLPLDSDIHRRNVGDGLTFDGVNIQVSPRSEENAAASRSLRRTSVPRSDSQRRNSGSGVPQEQQPISRRTGRAPSPRLTSRSGSQERSAAIRQTAQHYSTSLVRGGGSKAVDTANASEMQQGVWMDEEELEAKRRKLVLLFGDRKGALLFQKFVDENHIVKHTIRHRDPSCQEKENESQNSVWSRLFHTKIRHPSPNSPQRHAKTAEAGAAVGSGAGVDTSSNQVSHRESPRPSSTSKQRTPSADPHIFDRLYLGGLEERQRRQKMFIEGQHQRLEKELTETLEQVIMARILRRNDGHRCMSQSELSAVVARERAKYLEQLRASMTVEGGTEKVVEDQQHLFKRSLSPKCLSSEPRLSLDDIDELSLRLSRQGRRKYTEEEKLKEQRELKGCTFHPNINSGSTNPSRSTSRTGRASTPRGGQADAAKSSGTAAAVSSSQRSISSDRCNVLYTFAQREKQTQKQLEEKWSRAEKMKILKSKLASDHHFRSRVAIDPTLAEKFLASLVV